MAEIGLNLQVTRAYFMDAKLLGEVRLKADEAIRKLGVVGTVYFGLPERNSVTQLWEISVTGFNSGPERGIRDAR